MPAAKLIHRFVGRYDLQNDLTLSKAGHGIAVGNAEPAVMAVADRSIENYDGCAVPRDIAGLLRLREERLPRRQPTS